MNIKQERKKQDGTQGEYIRGLSGSQSTRWGVQHRDKRTESATTESGEETNRKRKKEIQETNGKRQKSKKKGKTESGKREKEKRRKKGKRKKASVSRRLFFIYSFLLSSFWTRCGLRCGPFSLPVRAFSFYRAQGLALLLLVDFHRSRSCAFWVSTGAQQENVPTHLYEYAFRQTRTRTINSSYVAGTRPDCYTTGATVLS